MNQPPVYNIDKMFADVLQWNVFFNVPIPDSNVNHAMLMLAEEFDEFFAAKDDAGRVDAIGDMYVVALGICARLVVRPVRCEYLHKRAGDIRRVKVDRFTLQGTIDAINSGTGIPLAISEFLEILYCHCLTHNIDIQSAFDKIMAANWTKFWTPEEAKTATGQVILPKQGIVVKNAAGKILKPPSFNHP